MLGNLKSFNQNNAWNLKNFNQNNAWKFKELQSKQDMIIIALF
jgi:hypothetical protein